MQIYHPRHARPHHYVVPVVVAAIVAVVAGLAFGLGPQREVAEAPPHADGHQAAPGSSGPDDVAPDGVAPGAGQESDEAVPATSTGPGALDRCRMQYDAQSPVLRSAARSIKQWEVHVRAMNQLVAGEITLDQAAAFWDRTRVGAQGRVADFRRADDAYAATAHECPAPKQADRAGRVRTCTRAVALRDKVVSVARRSIDTWAMHVRDMELLRDGKLSPTKATEMWQMSWHMGQHQIDAYHDALRAADRAAPCDT